MFYYFRFVNQNDSVRIEVGWERWEALSMAVLFNLGSAKPLRALIRFHGKVLKSTFY